MTVTIRRAAPADAVSLAPRLRASDVREVRASSGSSPLAALTESLRLSDHDMNWTALIDGRPEIMWGVVDLGNGVGGVWLLGSDAILDIKRTFWCESKRHIEHMHTRYRVLTNFIDYRNLPSLTWLEALGFKPVLADPAYGYEKRLFIQYLSRRQHHV